MWVACGPDSAASASQITLQQLLLTALLRLGEGEEGEEGGEEGEEGWEGEEEEEGGAADWEEGGRVSTAERRGIWLGTAPSHREVDKEGEEEAREEGAKLVCLGTGEPMLRKRMKGKRRGKGSCSSRRDMRVRGRGGSMPRGEGALTALQCKARP